MGNAGLPIDSNDSENLAGAHVLVVEDEPLILLDIARMLGKAGASALRARNLRKATAFLDVARIDAAVLDVNMGPEGDCLSIARDLRSRSIPFFLYSGALNDAGNLMTTFRAPLLRKPCGERDIIREVAKLLDQGGVRTPV